jgi:hypothetical protein
MKNIQNPPEQKKGKLKNFTGMSQKPQELRRPLK